MYHSWLDRWDERRAERGDEVKRRTDFALDTELAFPSSGHPAGIEAFCNLADQAVEDPTYFDEPGNNDLVVERKEIGPNFLQEFILTSQRTISSGRK